MFLRMTPVLHIKKAQKVFEVHELSAPRLHCFNVDLEEENVTLNLKRSF